MLTRISDVRPGEGLTLHLTYMDGATVHADVSSLLEGDPGVFAPLRDRSVFEAVTAGPRGRSVVWPGELDLDVDVFRAEPQDGGFPILAQTPALPPDPVSLAFRSALQASGLTQAEVAQRAGLQQPNLARLLDPHYHGHSLPTLRRVAGALGLQLAVELRPPAED